MISINIYLFSWYKFLLHKNVFDRTVARWVKLSGKPGMRSGQPPFKDSIWRTTQLNSLLPCWTTRELAAEFGVCHKTVLHILHDILGYRELADRWIPHEISECNNGTAMQPHRPCWTGTKGKVKTSFDESSLWTKPGLAHKNQTWNANQMNGSIPVLLVRRKCCKGDVGCHVWGNTAARYTPKADGKAGRRPI